MRTLAYAAYITPDGDILKGSFETFLSNNLDAYLSIYVTGSNPFYANNLGIITQGALAYPNAKGQETGVAPWMDDFFTSSVGYISELGYKKATPLLAWKAKFSVARMTDPGSCWIVAPIYALYIRDTNTSPLYTTMKEAYLASNSSAFTSLVCASDEMANFLKLKKGEMTGYSDSYSGFPSNMQPALAYSANTGIPKAKEAWDIFMKRSVKPSYDEYPEFNIVPR